MNPLVPAIPHFARVPVPRTSEATYAPDAAGNEWIAKREADMGCEALLAEALTCLLARRLGVRGPDAVFGDDGARHTHAPLGTSSALRSRDHLRATIQGPPRVALPIGAGPPFVMGEPRTLPAGVADPSRWVRDHLLRAA